MSADVAYLPEMRSDIAARRGPVARRVVLVAAILAGAALAALVTPAAEAAQAAQAAGTELTHLLRVMAGLKLLFAAGMLATVYWRLALPVSTWRLASYAAGGAAMAAGPVLIWDMAYLGWGAVLLHGGILAGALLLWRDPVVGERLGEMVARRRAILRVRA